MKKFLLAFGLLIVFLGWCVPEGHSPPEQECVELSQMYEVGTSTDVTTDYVFEFKNTSSTLNLLTIAEVEVEISWGNSMEFMKVNNSENQFRQSGQDTRYTSTENLLSEKLSDADKLLTGHLKRSRQVVFYSTCEGISYNYYSLFT